MKTEAILMAPAALCLLAGAALTRTALDGYAVNRARQSAQHDRHAGRYDQARATLKAALKRAPHAAELWTDLGQTERAAWFFGQRQDLLASAQHAFAKAAQLNPLSAAPHAELARTHALANAHDLANAAYLRALERDPRNPDLLVGRAQVLERQGHTRAALATYRTAARIRPNEHATSAEARLGGQP